MKILYSIFAAMLLLTATINAADNLKQLEASRVSESIQIDGRLNEAAWQGASIATDFTEYAPFPGLPASEKTEVHVLYDDNAVYLGVRMYTADPSSILKEFSLRDNYGNADYFGVLIDAYRDGINGVAFYVTASGVQIDSKLSSLGEDESWNAVWESKVIIDELGWTVEMAIPYSAIRFPEINEQLWNINFVRFIRETRQSFYWNKVDPEIQGILNQSGQISGISDIKPPVRLSATPFVVTSLEHRSKFAGKNWGSEVSGGVDVKYGISDAFTLDMTLIPDFSQARSDDQILNLSPFEVQFAENRQFFTEGTELFNKGGVFYSRRIGGRPIAIGNVQSQLAPGEIIEDNPSRARLLNATKVSGRTRNGLGLGVFNAITGNTWATVKNEADGSTRKVLTDPVSNYNVLVADQNLKNNSYVSFLNTNVMRSGSFRDANVSTALFELNTDGNLYGVRGGVAYSQQLENGLNNDGWRYNLNVGKRSGNLIYSLGAWIVDDKYNPNDLGFLQSGNEANFSFDIQYRIFEPKGIFQRISSTISVDYERLFKPSEFVNLELEWVLFGVTRDNVGLRLLVAGTPKEAQDFFEPRTSDFSRYYAIPKYLTLAGLVSTNYNRKFAIDVRSTFRAFDAPDRKTLQLSIEPRYRFSDKFTFSVEANIDNRLRDEGFVFRDQSSQGIADLGADDILFGTRDRHTLESSMSLRYIFHENMGITFRSRHYWSRVEYRKFGILDPAGHLSSTNYAGINESGKKLHDNNFNAFNIDLIYTWRYAPGSDLIFVWKNQILSSGDDLIINYLDNLDSLIDAPQVNSFSLKMIYFLDYLYLSK